MVGLFGPYFNELGGTVVEQDYNVELLVRTFDITSQLIFYLQQIPKPEEKTKRLLAKPLRRIEIISFDEINNQKSVKRASLRRAYRDALKKSKSNGNSNDDIEASN